LIFLARVLADQPFAANRACSFSHDLNRPDLLYPVFRAVLHSNRTLGEIDLRQVLARSLLCVASCAFSVRKRFYPPLLPMPIPVRSIHDFFSPGRADDFSSVPSFKTPFPLTPPEVHPRGRLVPPVRDLRAGSSPVESPFSPLRRGSFFSLVAPPAPRLCGGVARSSMFLYSCYPKAAPRLDISLSTIRW